MVKAPYFDKNGVKKGAWSQEEDNKLKAYIQRYGHWNWRELPKFAGLSRCGKSCRLRWMNYLRPDVKRGNYNKEEEEIIINLQEQLGNKWSVIAAKLPGRTDNEIKNHFHTHLKKKRTAKPSDVKEQPIISETSHSKNRDSKSDETVRTDEILIPETSSSDLSGTHWVPEEDSLASSETFQESSGDFWNEPFLEDNIFIENSCPLSLLDEGFISPYLSYYDDGVDLFYQLI